MIEQGHIAETNDRTVGAFSAVIAEYSKHLRRTLARSSKPVVTFRQRRRTMIDLVMHQPRVKATIYYLGTIQQLEVLNG